MLIKNKGLFGLGIVFAAVNALDVATTIFAVQNGGQEGNPIAAIVVNNPAALITLKCVGILAILYMVHKLNQSNDGKKSYLGHIALCLCIAVITAAVVNNVLILHSHNLL